MRFKNVVLCKSINWSILSDEASLLLSRLDDVIFRVPDRFVRQGVQTNSNESNFHCSHQTIKLSLNLLSHEADLVGFLIREAAFIGNTDCLTDKQVIFIHFKIQWLTYIGVCVIITKIFIVQREWIDDLRFSGMIARNTTWKEALRERNFFVPVFTLFQLMPRNLFIIYFCTYLVTYLFEYLMCTWFRSCPSQGISCQMSNSTILGVNVQLNFLNEPYSNYFYMVSISINTLYRCELRMFSFAKVKHEGNSNFYHVLSVNCYYSNFNAVMPSGFITYYRGIAA